ncbi:MAG: diguanylate cyclase [Sedimenticola sp.]
MLANLKLYQKTLLSFLLAIIVIAIFLYVGLEQIKKDLIDNKKIELVKTTKLVGTMAESLFDTSIQNYLRGISETHLNTTQYYYTLYKQGVITEKKAKENIEALLLSHTIGTTGYVTSVDISKGNNAITLAIHPKAQGSDISKFEFVQKMAKMKKGYLEFEWKNPGENKRRLKAEYMSYFEPWQWIINAAPYKNEFYSLLDLDFFRNNLDMAQLSKTEGSYVAVFDIEGNNIYHPVLKPGQSFLSIQDAKTGEYFIRNIIEYIKSKASNETVTGWVDFTYTRRGEAVGPASDKLLYYSFLPNHNWVVATIINKDEVLQPYHTLRRDLMWTGGLIFIGVIVIALFFSRYITNRLAQLVRASNHLAQHHYDTTITRMNRDEIGDLEQAFGDSVRTIKKLIQEQKEHNILLEAKVEERTIELEEKNRELEQLSVTDRLTGLFNRRKLDESLEFEMKRTRRSRHQFGLILLDIDHFKSVNDTFGHQVGDQVLVDIANILLAQTRSIDYVGRWGGEEFLIISPRADKDGLKILAEKLRREIEEHSFPEVGHKSASFGVAMYNYGDTIASVIAQADTALYQAKNSGRNRVNIYQEVK